MVSLKITSLLITALINLILGIVVLAQGKRNKSTITFSILTLTISVWAISLFFFSITKDINTALIFSKGAYFSGGLISIILLNFSIFFNNNRLQKKTIILLQFYNTIALFFLAFSVYSGGVITEIKYLVPSGKLLLVFGPTYIYYSLLTSFSLFASLCLLIQKNFQTDNLLIKIQIKYIFVGITISIIGAVVPNLIFPSMGNFEFYWLGPIFTLIMIILISIAVFKHNLFNIKIIAVEFLAFLFSLTILIQFILSSAEDKIINGVLFVFVAGFSIRLVRSILKETQKRKRIIQLGRDLTVANENLRQLDQKKSDFISIASHQLRSPLTAIKGYASLLLEGSFGKIPDKAREAVAKIFEASQSLITTIENFLTASHIERGKMLCKFETFDLQVVIEEMAKELSILVNEHDLELNFNRKPEQKFFVQADIIKIKQVINNLLNYSVKNTKKGFIKISISHYQRRDKIRLTISDTGEGVERDRLRQLFERYEQNILSSEANSKVSVELFIVKEIIKAHHGKIWAESGGIGRGLTFIIELPAIKQQTV